MKPLVQVFTELAEIDSPSGNEELVAQYIVEYLRNLGLQPSIDGSGMVYCRVPGKDTPKLFCAHMDTVEPGKGVKVVEEEGFLRSDGTTIVGGDNKASLAAILYSVAEHIESGCCPNVELLFSVREETNSGIQQFDTSILKSKVGYIFDGGNGELSWLVSQASTIQDVTIELRGLSSHASRPEEGRNALEVLMNLGKDLQIGRIDATTTFNIGLISGGNATNTIPECLRLEGDLRSSGSLQHFETVRSSIERAFAHASGQYGVTPTFTWVPYAYGYQLNRGSHEYKRLFEIYSQHNIVLNPVATTSGSDAGFLNSIGIETFCLGDGVKGIHTLQECISIETFKQLQVIIKDLMA